MGIPHEIIAEFPAGLNARPFKLKERHKYLKYLGLAQYDPTKRGYINIQQFATTSDEEFASQIAKTSLECYDSFLKTL